MIKLTLTKNRIANVSRRTFMRYAGVATGLSILVAGCSRDDEGIDLGTGGIGILNYAYTLEQLEAAFYTQAVLTPYPGMTDDEQIFLKDIRDHEIAHREFFKKTLGGNAIPDLEFDFFSINFSSRDAVLGAAEMLEDLGVSAYNGIAYLIRSGSYLLVAGKIVSVEARHAALIRELRNENSFLGTELDVNAVNIAKAPAAVLAIVAPYIKSKLNPGSLPTG